MQTANELTRKLKLAGMRMTPQRIAICRQLCETDRHPTANQIYENLKDDYPSLSLMTVYNTLKALVEVGAIRFIGSACDGNAHYDGDIDPHINLACISCNKIVDIPDSAAVLDKIHSAVPQGYKIIGSSVLIYGLCPDCQKD